MTHAHVGNALVLRNQQYSSCRNVGATYRVGYMRETPEMMRLLSNDKYQARRENSYLPGAGVHRDHKGGAPRVRPGTLHSFPGWPLRSLLKQSIGHAIYGWGESAFAQLPEKKIKVISLLPGISHLGLVPGPPSCFLPLTPRALDCCIAGFCSSVRSIIIRMPKNTFALVYCNRAYMQ